MIDQKYVRELFSYNKGKLYWNKKRQNIQIGDEAGSINSTTGYRRIMDKDYI